MIGKNFTELAPNLKETGRYDLYMDVIKTGNHFYASDIVPHPKFGDIHLEVRAFKVGAGFGMITTDITQRVRAEEELTRQVQELELFNRLAVGRELRMIELKRQINELSEQLGKEAPYDLSLLE